MKYLTQSDLEPNFTFNYAEFQPISSDTYDESEIYKAVSSQNCEQLFACALQFAIVGTGNSSFGKVKIAGQEVSIEHLMKQNNVKFYLPINSKLEPGELTLRRLARFFRFHISKYIKTTGTHSFLYSKYAESGYPEYTFPCSEYLVTTGQEEGIVSAYQALDQSLGTRFYTRTSQILKSRKVVTSKTKKT
jgi:hypothetical protein